MKIHDITLPIFPEMIVWPGDPPVVVEQVESMDEGATYNLTHLKTSAHAGTHVDAPHHFMNNHRTVESLPLEVLTGPAYVVRIPDEVDAIGADVFEGADIPSGTERLLLKTRNSALWADGVREFDTNFAAVVKDGAEWLVAHGIRLIGVDYLSVAPFKQGEPVHQVLLGAGVVIVEGLNLSEVRPGAYDLYCLPLKLVGSDGAPARAILVE